MILTLESQIHIYYILNTIDIFLEMGKHIYYVIQVRQVMMVVEISITGINKVSVVC